MDKPVQKVPVDEEFPRVLTLREKIAYGFGDCGNDFIFDTGQLYLLKPGLFTSVFGT